MQRLTSEQRLAYERAVNDRLFELSALFWTGKALAAARPGREVS